MISWRTGTYEKEVLFPKWKFLFHFFKAIFDSSFRPLRNFAPVYSIPVQVSPLGYKPLPLISLTRCISPEVISGSRLYKRIRAYECPRDLSQARVLITYFDVFPSSQGT